jgi:gas vesicle protein
MGLGAILGGVAGYLLFTERGRQMREELEPRLEELLGEVDKLRTTFERTRSAVSEGLESFNQLVNEAPAQAKDAATAWTKETSRGPAH